MGSNPTPPEEPKEPEKIQEQPQPPQEPSRPTTLEEAKQEITIEDRLGKIENFMFKDLPLSLKQYDESIQKREEANHHKLLDDIIAAVSKKGTITPAEAASAGSTPAVAGKDGGWGWVKDILDNPLVKNLMGGEGGADTEIINLEKEFNNRMKLEFRDLLRQRLGLPSLPSTTHTQDAGH